MRFAISTWWIQKLKPDILVIRFTISMHFCNVIFRFLSLNSKHSRIFGRFHERQCNPHFQTLHAAGQIDILRYWLTQFTSHENKSIVITTRKIIQKHKKIINFSENIECLYTHIALLQFVSNTVMICCLCFLIITVSNIVEYIKLLWLCSINCEVYN